MKSQEGTELKGTHFSLADYIKGKRFGSEGVGL